jgi:hypothetical protein
MHDERHTAVRLPVSSALGGRLCELAEIALRSSAGGLLRSHCDLGDALPTLLILADALPALAHPR